MKLYQTEKQNRRYGLWSCSDVTYINIQKWYDIASGVDIHIKDAQRVKSPVLDNGYLYLSRKDHTNSSEDVFYLWNEDGV